VPVDGDLAASALAESLRLLVGAIPRAWERERPGILGAVTGSEAPTLNGVWVYGVDAGSGDIADLLDDVAATGLPHCLQGRPASAGRLEELATARGMSSDDAIPLMVFEHPSPPAADVRGDALVIRELEPEDAALHAVTAAAGFEAPIEVFLQLITPQVLGMDGVRCYLGEVNGEAVTTGLGATFGAYVAIFNIATPPAHRHRGYGAAVTARAVADGFASGATWSWLQASPSGLAVYTRLGFRTVESWYCWVAPPAS
jgi:N-acetylglutamate synthase